MPSSSFAFSVLELAPGAYVAQTGDILNQPPVGSAVVKGPGLPPLDQEIKQHVLSLQSGAIADGLGLSGSTRALFDDAVQLGEIAMGAYTGATWAVGILQAFGFLSSGSDPVADALAALAKQIKLLDQKLGAFVKYTTSTDKAQMDNALNDLAQSIDWLVAKGKPEDRQAVEDNLKSVKEFMAALIHPLYSKDVVTEPFDLNQYKDTEFYKAMYHVGYFPYQQQPWWQDAAVATIGKDWPATRWDYRGWIPMIARGAALVLLGHQAQNTATRTAGKYRKELQDYADNLRALARRVMATIQLTPPLPAMTPGDFTKDAYTVGAPYRLGSFHSLVWGRPVGAVDTILGDSLVEKAWRPADHGFPELAGLAFMHFKAPALPGNLWVAVEKARKKADAERMAAWVKLVVHHPVIPSLFKLADMFEKLATPPATSETVAFQPAEWMGSRTLAETRVESVGTAFCEPKEFSVDIYELNQHVTVRTPVQPDLFRISVHEVGYRFRLESADPTSEKLPHPLFTKGFAELSEGEGVAVLAAPTFDLDLLAPQKLTLALDAFVAGDIADPPSFNKELAYYWYVSPSGDSGAASHIVNVAKVTVDQPIEQRQGKITVGPTVTLSAPYTLTRHDGAVVLTLRNTPNVNALLWLVIEEEVGFSAPNLRVRTGLRLPLIGVERYWPEDYFKHVSLCMTKADAVLKDALVWAIETGQPIPQPDPVNDPSFASYVTRVQRSLRGRPVRPVRPELDG
jgi:hypothetical protein